MSGEGLDPLKRYLVKGIAGGIGLASESISAYKARKRVARNEASSDTEVKEAKLEPRITELPCGSEETLWELDDAQTQVLSSKEKHQVVDENSRKSPKQRGFDDLKSFLVVYPPPPSETRSALSFPVILPQRRPKTRTRGFVRAYAPVLNDCAISQDMFLDFLETFHRSSQASPWIAAVNLAGLGLSFIPHFPMLVGLAIQASVMVAEDVQNRTRTNSFLDKANAEVFRPRGLFCLIMAFDPSATRAGQDVQLSSTIATRLNPSGREKFENKLKESSGVTISEMDFPEAAPLIFPALDDDVDDDNPSQEAASTKEKLGKKKKYVEEYYDKRARAKFAGKHPDSVLARGPQPIFTSRYADPNHPAASGSFRSLITGGLINPPSMTRPNLGSGGRLVQGRFGGLGDLVYRPGGNLREQILSERGGFFSNPPAPYGGSSSSENPPQGSYPQETYQQAAYSQGTYQQGSYSQGSYQQGSYQQGSYSQGAYPQGRQSDTGLLGLPTPGGLIKKALKKNVLYLMIVNMPTEKELAEAMNEIGERRKQGFALPSFLGRL